MLLGWALRQIDNKDATLEIIGNVKEHIKEALDDLRRLSHQLAPLVDSSVSLREKIKTLTQNMNSNKLLNINIQIDEFETPAKEEIMLTFYRIVQEQFNNIVKYAKATRVDININAGDKETILLIKDNGKGFDTNKYKKGIGLQNIKRRAQVLGGEVGIFSSPGNGCEVLVRIPMKK